MSTEQEQIEEAIAKGYDNHPLNRFDTNGINPYAYRLGFLDGYRHAKTSNTQSYNSAIDDAIEIAKRQCIYPVEGQVGKFIDQNTFITVLNHLKKPS